MGAAHDVTRSTTQRCLISDLVIDEIKGLIDERITAALRERDEDRAVTPWLTTRECAERLRVSERTVARMVKAGRIRTCSVGRRVLVHTDDLDGQVRGDADGDATRTSGG